MKKIIITTLCLAAFSLTACDKKVDTAESKDTATQQDSASLSTNNKSDIKADFEAIAKLSTSKSEEALKMQEDAANATDPAAAQNTIKKKKKYFKQFNEDLSKIKLKSSEVNDIRTQMINLNKTTFDMMDQSMSGTPDVNKITELQAQLEKDTANLSANMQKVEAMIK